MDLFGKLIYLCFIILIQKIQNNLTTNFLAQNSNEEITINIESENTNKIILHNESFLLVNLKIKSTLDIQSEGCEKSAQNILICNNIELTFPGLKNITFFAIKEEENEEENENENEEENENENEEENENENEYEKENEEENKNENEYEKENGPIYYYLYLFAIKYEFKNIKCFHNESEKGQIDLYYKTEQELSIEVNLTSNNIDIPIPQCTNSNNSLTCPLEFKEDKYFNKLTVSIKNPIPLSDSKEIDLNYYFSSIPTISDFYYPEIDSNQIKLNFEYPPKFLKDYFIQINGTLYEIKNEDKVYYIEVNLTQGQYNLNFTSKCDSNNFGKINIIGVLEIKMSYYDLNIEIGEFKQISMSFNDLNFCTNNMKIYLNTNSYELIKSNQNYYFTTDNQLNVGTFNISIERNNHIYPTDKKFRVYQKDNCKIINDLFAIQNPGNIEFDIQCYNEIKEINQYSCNIINNQSTCNATINTIPGFLYINITTWKPTILPIKIIKYGFNQLCSADLNDPINLTLEYTNELTNTNFTANKIYSVKKDSLKTIFTFIQEQSLENLVITYNSTNNFVIDNTSNIIVTNLSNIIFYPKYLSNYNSNQTIVFTYESSIKMKQSVIKLKTSNKEIPLNANCLDNSTQCKSEINLNGEKEGTYSLSLTDHCNKEKTIDNTIIVLSNINITNKTYSKIENNKKIVISTSNLWFFNQKGDYFIIINNIESKISIENGNLTFLTPNVQPSYYSIFIKHKNEFNYDYIFPTNSILYLYENEVNLKTPLKFLYVDQKYNEYNVDFYQKIYPWQINDTLLEFDGETIHGNITNDKLTFIFKTRLKFFFESQMKIKIFIVNGDTLTYYANVIKDFSFVYPQNFISDKNNQTLLYFEKYDNDDKFFQNSSNGISSEIKCKKIDFMLISCEVTFYEDNNLTICYYNNTNCKNSSYYKYEIINYDNCIDDSRNIEISINGEEFHIYIHAVEKNDEYKFNNNNSKYVLNTENINSNIYQIYINTTNQINPNYDFPIEESFKIYKDITSNDTIKVNINTYMIPFSLIYDEYIYSKEKLTIQLSNGKDNVTSIFCYLMPKFAQCLFNLTSLPYGTYNVLYQQFCSMNYKTINNLSVIITEEIIIKYPIIEINENWNVPSNKNISVMVKYDTDNIDDITKFIIRRIVLVNSNRIEEPYEISFIQNNNVVNLTIQNVGEDVSDIYFIKTEYIIDEHIFTEISNYPHYLVISKKPNFNLNKNYFLKTNNESLNVEIEKINFIDTIKVFLNQSKNYENLDNNQITINNDKNLEGYYTIVYSLCDNCPKLNDDNNENIIIIHENQSHFFENIKINDCLLKTDLYYVIKIDFNKILTKDKITIFLNDIILEESENYYRIKKSDEDKITESNELTIKENKNPIQTFIYRSTIKVTTFEIKEEFFYASKGIPLVNFTCILREYNFTLTTIKEKESRNLTFSKVENDIIFYSFKDNEYIYGNCTFNSNKYVFSSNDLENTAFHLKYSNVQMGYNEIIIVNNFSDYYLQNIETVSFEIKSFGDSNTSKVEYIDINKTLKFDINNLKRDEVYIIKSINSKDGHKSINITNNIIGLLFYISPQYFLFEKNKKAQETKSIIFNFKTPSDVTTNITILDEYGEIKNCKEKGDQVTCFIILKISANTINITIKDHTDYIYEYVYEFIEGTECQSMYNKTATKDIKIAIERPKNIDYEINIFYDKTILNNSNNTTFILNSKSIAEFNRFDVMINSIYVNYIVDKLLFYDMLKVVYPTDTISIVMNTIENNQTFQFLETSLHISQYEYFLYKKDDPSFEKIMVKKLKSNETFIDFQFDLYSLKEERKHKLNPEIVNFGYIEMNQFK